MVCSTVWRPGLLKTQVETLHGVGTCPWQEIQEIFRFCCPPDEVLRHGSFGRTWKRENQAGQTPRGIDVDRVGGGHNPLWICGVLSKKHPAAGSTFDFRSVAAGNPAWSVSRPNFRNCHESKSEKCNSFQQNVLTLTRCELPWRSLLRQLHQINPAITALSPVADGFP